MPALHVERQPGVNASDIWRLSGQLGRAGQLVLRAGQCDRFSRFPALSGRWPDGPVSWEGIWDLLHGAPLLYALELIACARSPMYLLTVHTPVCCLFRAIFVRRWPQEHVAAAQRRRPWAQ